jgi:hypothetical protein
MLICGKKLAADNLRVFEQLLTTWIHRSSFYAESGQPAGVCAAGGSVRVSSKSRRRRPQPSGNATGPDAFPDTACNG